MFISMLNRLLNMVLQTESLTSPTGTSQSEEVVEVRSLEELIADREAVMAAYEKKGYRFFDGGKDYNVNLFGVRVDNPESNRFDDYLCAVYREGGEWKHHVWSATTDPGRHWLQNPLSPKGTAILMPGQYRSTWKIAKHQGKYEALCQRKPVKVWRDNNKDDILDYGCEETQEGLFGINIHRSNPRTQSYLVEKWSAGCQVFQKVDDYNLFMEICNKSAKAFGNSFTYTLFEERDFAS